MSKEALKLALHKAFSLGSIYWQQVDSEFSSNWKKGDVTKAQFDQLVEDTIKQALEQPVQEPVAYLYQCRKKPELKALSFKKHEPELFAKGYKAIPLSDTTPPAAPVAWQHIESAPKDGTRILCKNEKGLVDICEWTEDRFTSSDDRTFGGHLAYTSWTPLPHSGLTIPVAPVQEPVLLFYEYEWEGRTSRQYQWLIDPFELPTGTKLYATPPAAQRPWVKLTDEQKLDVVTDYFDHVDGDWAVKKASQLLDTYESKLKELNT